MLEAPSSSMRTPPIARQKALFWLAVAIILVVSSLAIYSIQRLVALSERVERTQNILIETSRFLSDIKDVENGGRSYFLTGDQQYLRTQRTGARNAKATATRLRGLQPAGELKRRVERLINVANHRVEYSLILPTLHDRRSEANRFIAEGTRLMDQARAEADHIIRLQKRIYLDEQESLERQAWLAKIALGAGITICLLIVARLFSIRGNEVQRRRQLEEELLALNLVLEDKVQERTAEVKRARDLLNAVVENIPDMVLLKQPSGNGFQYVLINKAGETLLGRERSEILGRTEREVFPAEEAAMVVNANKAVIESGQARVFTDRKLTTTNGIRSVETRMVPIANGNGSPVLILAIIRDVTEARAMEEQLRQLQRMDAIGRLTGGVAHDFNNLLAIIHGNAELLRGRQKDGSDAAEMADDVIGAAHRGAELVRRLLAFARMQHLEPESVDLNDRLTSIQPLLQRSLGENVHVRINPGNALWPAIVDPTQVDDALVNMAINARDAMRGGGRLTIETQNVVLDEDYAAHHVEVTPGEYVMLAVSDTGTGMAPEVMAKAFEPFFTTKEEGQGTGLGLSQVFGWVKQSGGHIKIYSELGHGTTIKLYLPRADAAASNNEKNRPEIATPKGDETILVVEDNPSVRKTVVRQLQDLGYKTIEADSAASAMQLIGDGEKFDLLLTDVIMPGGMTGYQLADQLRETRPDQKVLFTSGYTELAASGEQVVRRDSLLSKPYRKHDLGRAVRAVLDDSKSAG